MQKTTSIMDLIAYIEENYGADDVALDLKAKAQSLIPKEREQLINAHLGTRKHVLRWHIESAEDYYTQTYQPK